MFRLIQLADTLRDEYKCTLPVNHIRMIRTWNRTFVIDGRCDGNAHILSDIKRQKGEW